MQKIRCVVERITYQNPENGYSVLKCRVKDYSDLVPVIGNMIDGRQDSAGDKYRACPIFFFFARCGRLRQNQQP